MKNSSWAIMLLALLLTAGCSEDATDPANNATDQANDAADQSDSSTEQTGDSDAQTSNADASAGVSSAGDTAEAAVQAVMEGLSAGNATVVWAAMPPGYQNDINEIVQAFGNGMDPAQWQMIQGAVSKVHTVLSTKADFIINVPELQGMEQSEQLKDVIPKIAGLLKIVIDHTDLESLKSFDGQAFFSGPASSLVAQVDSLSKLSPNGFSLASLKDATIETISSEGDKAILKITNPMDATKAQEVEFVKVDGRWVPADMASGWDANMAEAKADLATLPETVKESAMMVTMMTSVVTTGLEPLEAAEDQDQFNTAVEQLKNGMGQMMGPMLFGGFPGGGTTTEIPSDFEPPVADEVTPVEEDPAEGTDEDSR